VEESEANNSERAEKFFRGTAVAPGIAHAVAIVHSFEEDEVPFRKITPAEMPTEIARFAHSIGAIDAGIFDAHLLVVEDRTLIDEVLRNLEKDNYNVETVFHQVAEKYCRSLAAIDDPYLRERAVDIEDVSRRVLRHLMGRDTRTLTSHERPHIIISHNLTPSDTALMNRSLVMGFATEAGSKTSHTAIMARALSIPAIVGLEHLCAAITSGDDLLIDGYSGTLIINPSPATLELYGRLELQKEEVEERLELIRDTSSTTMDGQHVILSANIELAEELEDVAASGSEGIGLYRTEFLYLNRTTPPTEEEQFANYRLVAEKALPHAVIIRTLDIGGDKSTDSLDLPIEQNPFLGSRAIRFCLDHPEIFHPQIRAILRAGLHGKVKIMLPMISGVEEFRQAKAVIDACCLQLEKDGVPFAAEVEVGTMIEIPGAALSARWLAREASFFSVGTNDLIQYTLAIDRVNEHVAHLYQPTHPAILRLLKMTADAAHEAGIWCGVCGEMAGEIGLTPLLLGLGMDELSTSPSRVPRVKKAVQSLSLTECQSLAMEAMGLGDAEEILRLSEELARSRYKDLF
jgi:phosphotransferase system enzyme I (PtsI)